MSVLATIVLEATSDAWPLRYQMYVQDPIDRMLGNETSVELIARGLNELVDVKILEAREKELDEALLVMKARERKSSPIIEV